MMNKNLRILAGVTALLIAVLFAVQLGDRSQPGADALLFPDLRSRINDATTLTITRADDEDATVIRKTADAWVNESRDDYRVDVGKLRELLLALSEAKTIEQKTANPDRYGQLGVGDPANEGSKGTRLQVAGDGLLLDLIVGNVAQPGYRYARRFDDTQSWLIDKDPSIPASTADWLVKDIVDIKADTVRSVTITHPDGEEIRISKASAEQTDYDVADIPADRELSYATVANGIAGALNALAFDDVRKGDAFAGDAVTTAFETFDGERITVLSREEDGTNWIMLSAASGAIEDGAENDAAAINEQVAGWQFTIAAYKANQLTRRWEDILKAPPETEQP